MNVQVTTQWRDMPQLASFDELLTWGGFKNYVDNGHCFQILFINGVFYSGNLASASMTKCPPESILDVSTLQ